MHARLLEHASLLWVPETTNAIRTLILLSLFSFMVKFGLMVQISDLWQFLLFLFPLLTTMQLLKLQMPTLAGLRRA
jgi:uncharacterized membrane protein YccC